MDDDRQAFEFAYALYLDREIDRKAAQMIAGAAEAGGLSGLGRRQRRCGWCPYLHACEPRCLGTVIGCGM